MWLIWVGGVAVIPGRVAVGSGQIVASKAGKDAGQKSVRLVTSVVSVAAAVTVTVVAFPIVAPLMTVIIPTVKFETITVPVLAAIRVPIVLFAVTSVPTDMSLAASNVLAIVLPAAMNSLPITVAVAGQGRGGTGSKGKCGYQYSA